MNLAKMLIVTRSDGHLHIRRTNAGHALSVSDCLLRSVMLTKHVTFLEARTTFCNGTVVAW